MSCSSHISPVGPVPTAVSSGVSKDTDLFDSKSTPLAALSIAQVTQNVKISRSRDSVNIKKERSNDEVGEEFSLVSGTEEMQYEA